jgi:hypothetical protein
MHESIHISFNPRIEKFEEYFQEWDEARYNGELQKGKDSGKFIWLEKERILIGKQRLDTYKKWLDSFDELINVYGLIAGNRPEELKPFFESGKTYHAFNNLSKIDPNDKYGFGLVSFFFNRVLEQPLYYLESVQKFEKELNEFQIIYHRYGFLEGKIRVAKDKFHRTVFEFQNDILNYLRNEPRKAEVLLKEVILATENILVRIGCISQDYSFNYKESPLLAVYMDFIKDVRLYLKFLNKSGELPLINNFLEKSEDIKKPFEIKMESKPENVSAKIHMTELFTDTQDAQKVNVIFKVNGYTENGKWIGQSKRKKELLAAYYILKPLLVTGKPTTQAKIFYKEFGLVVGKNDTKNGEYITERSLTNEPFNEDRDEFKRIFSHLISKSR